MPDQFLLVLTAIVDEVVKPLESESDANKLADKVYNSTDKESNHDHKTSDVW